MAKTSEAGLKAIKKWDAAHKDDFKKVFMKLHKEKDADIIEKLDSESNTTGYIKKLIREDIGENEKND